MTSLRLSSSLLISALVILLGLVLTQSTASLAASPSVFRATPQAIHSMALVNDLSQFDEFDNIDIDEFMAESSTGESSSSSSSTGMDSSSSSSTGDDSSSSSSSSSTGMESSSSSSSSTGVDSSSSSTASPSSSSSSSSPSSSSSSTGPASSSSSSSSGPQSSTGSVSSSTGTAPSVSIPAKFPLMSFVLTKPRSFFGGAASLTENVIPELATVCGIFNSRVVIMSMTESNNQTTITFAISDPLVSTERTSVAAAEKFLAIKNSGVAPTTAVLQYLSLTSMGLQTDRTSMGALPQVSFKLNFDLTSLPGGSATEFSNMLRDEVAYIFSIRVSRITIVAIRPGSIAVDMIIAPSVLPTDPAANTIANEFVEQSRNTSSPLYTSGTITSQVIPNSAAVGYPLVAESADLGESSNDDIGVLSRGGFIALIVVASIAAITLVVLGVYIYAIRQPTATKNSTMLHSTENSRIGGGAHAADAAGAGDVQLTVMDDEPAVQPPETDRPVHFKVSPRIDEDDAQVQPAMSPLSESAGVVRLHTEQDGL